MRLLTLSAMPVSSAGMPSGSLRVRKKERVRESLAREAARLFREKGFESTTIEEIAAGADVSRRTFFRYFPSKESVVFPKARERMYTFRRFLEAQPGGAHGVEAVLGAGFALAEHLASDRDELLLQSELVGSSSALQVFERAVDAEWEASMAHALAERSSGDADATRRARILASILMGLFRSVLREWCAAGCRGLLVDIARDAVRLLPRIANLENPTHPRMTP